jgi:TrmH family RNA methyltransferase
LIQDGPPPEPDGLREAAPVAAGGKTENKVVITSRDNEKLKLVRKLHDRRWRDKLGLFVAEGEDLLAAARQAGIEPSELLVAGEMVEPRLLAEVSALAHPPRVIAVFERGDLPRAPLPEVGLGLWRVADPGNVGTLLRAADALGPAFVALSPGCADPTGPKAIRASMGAVFRVPTCALDDAPGRRVALVPRGGAPLAELELEEPILFLLGAEREGLPHDLAVDVRASIPQAEAAESLNVAMAGTVALYELARRRLPS